MTDPNAEIFRSWITDKANDILKEARKGGEPDWVLAAAMSVALGIILGSIRDKDRRTQAVELSIRTIMPSLSAYADPEVEADNISAGGIK